MAMTKEGLETHTEYKDRRLWIGNLDLRITEYQLLKLVQKYGNIVKFDLLFHRTGPQAGQPRGYAFVTYMKKEDALRAKEKLHNMLVGQKNIIVAWANSINDETIIKPQKEVIIPALAMAKPQGLKDRESQIQAIEAKLKLLEEKTTLDLKINETVATKSPTIAQYQYKKMQNKVKSKIISFKKLQPYRKNSNNSTK